MERRIAGFTLIEALIAIAVCAVALAIGVPGVARTLAETRTQAASHDMVASLALARSTAIAVAAPVTVCPIDAARHCRDDGVWDIGWMVFRDTQRRGQPRREQDIVQVVDAPDGHLRIRGSTGHIRARFQPDGLSSGNTLTLRICSARDDRLMAEVILNNAGRPRTTDRRDDGLRCAS
jgi:type IV fimbrial biogenesis protein FimT